MSVKNATPVDGEMGASVDENQRTGKLAVHPIWREEATTENKAGLQRGNYGFMYAVPERFSFGILMC